MLEKIFAVVLTLTGIILVIVLGFILLALIIGILLAIWAGIEDVIENLQNFINKVKNATYPTKK